jgi:malate dehydrogenase (oxaloacetate-decarboxylating)(NADP+)
MSSFGLSVKGAVTPRWSCAWRIAPILFAMANPDPEITPEDAKARASGRDRGDRAVRLSKPGEQRSGFPYIFRGALDVGASTINDEMKIAAARRRSRTWRARTFRTRWRTPMADGATLRSAITSFPKPFDPRLILAVPPAVKPASPAVR